MTLTITNEDAAGWSEGTWPLGAEWDEATGTASFAVHAPRATRVLLEFYAEAVGADAAAESDLARGADGVWRARIGGIEPGVYYAFRVWGPGWDVAPTWARGDSAAGFTADVDESGNRFNPNKVLFDPYAREISHNLSHPALTGTHAGQDARAADRGGAEVLGTGGDLVRGRPRRELDSGRWAPKSVLVHDQTATGVRPRRRAEDAVICEAHVRTSTAHPSVGTLRAGLAGVPGFADVVDIPEQFRGTYRGMGLLAPYLRAAGFTAVELLPVHASDTTAAPGDGGTTNYWGYQTLAFFAPNRDYAYDRDPGGPTHEFKEMVRAFHDHGLEVYLDVVYNHTGEGGHWGGDLHTTGFTSLGGFAASEYYSMTDEHRLIDGATGTSNQMNHSSAASRALVLDSLRYWADEMDVDGFRFDLAPVLGRTPSAFEREDWSAQRRFFPEHPLLVEIAEFARRRHVEVIAEAWDLWGYEVGNFPPGWGEWNGRYRDTMRDYLKGDGNVEEFMRKLNGDHRHFADQGGPQRSVNFVTAHDGFTLMDLVSYPAKVNDGPPPFGPSDGGSDDNRSWDSGGDRDLRRVRLRNLWTILFLSRGVPMVVSGDEFGRTQNGNNNPWSLNSIGIWNNYAMVSTNAPHRVAVDPARPEIGYHDNFGTAAAPSDVNPYFRFAVALARLRGAEPALRQARYGDLDHNDDDVSYFFTRPDGTAGPGAGDRAVRVHIDGSGVGGHDYLLLVNMAAEEVTFAVPDSPHGDGWRRIIDTAGWAEPEFNVWLDDSGAPTPEAEVVTGDYTVMPWSVAVLREG
ncbi:glycogen-debranching protein [Occultella glacieicola]|uniref:Glycogen-debranching protein n=1 Tax=Occultella glacieicola TaxID=2518684 RepID=A0ABY2E286_9MICO|nr:alpha-amylase family glycosyl hydrolase [Occultella glacieicola]TDE92714.1 glycogen-debranching protein [Occultella glacieicola]